MKHKKYIFGAQELEYLSHIVIAQGVKVDPIKIQVVVVNWSQPSTITELKGFLGLTRYYRKFVRVYGMLARPFTNLLKEGQFGWSDEAVKTFEQLKQALTSILTLALPNFSEPFVIETDASEIGIGAVLSQQRRSIAYMS